MDRLYHLRKLQGEKTPGGSIFFLYILYHLRKLQGEKTLESVVIGAV